MLDFSKPGIMIITKADYDGWPQGMPQRYVGPFTNYDEGQQWAKQEYGPFHSGWHLSWQNLEEPGPFLIKEE